MLSHYFEMLFREQELSWQEGCRAEIESIIDAIVAEAVSQVEEKIAAAAPRSQGQQKSLFPDYSIFRNLLISIRNDLAVLGAAKDKEPSLSFDDPESDLLAKAAPQLTHRQKFHLAKTRIQQVNALIRYYESQQEKDDIDHLF